MNRKKVFSVRREAMIWDGGFKSGSRVIIRALKRSVQAMPPNRSVKVTPKLRKACNRERGHMGCEGDVP